jgi:hypothetical protein
MTVVHVVLFQFRADAKPEAVKAVRPYSSPAVHVKLSTFGK